MSIVVNFIGDRLRRARMSAGLNGKTLAGMAGIAPAYLTQLEKGKRSPSPDLLIKLASVLRVDIESFGDEVNNGSDRAVREECGFYMADTVQELKSRIATLERELDQAREVIHNQSVALAQGRAIAAPAAGVRSGVTASKQAERRGA